MRLGIWVAAIALLWAPGYLAATLLRLTRREERAVALAVQLALGLSIWPLVLLWSSAAHIAWSVRAMAVVTWITIAVGLAVRAWGRRVGTGGALLVVMAVLFAMTVALRIRQVDGLAFPPWVDGVHHVMITRLVLEQGAIPETADPFIPGGDFFYHWGFHATFAFVAAAIGQTSPPALPPLLLQYGQVLNALSFFAMYAAGRTFLRSRAGGLVAAVLAMFVSYYPAFYLSWGRYPHLCGTLVLPALLIVLDRLSRSTAAVPWREGSGAVLLAAGLVLIHVRIALFALAFAVVLAAAQAVRAPRRSLGTLGRWGIVALGAMLAISPWLIRLGRTPAVAYMTHVAEPAATGEPSWLPLLHSLHNRELLSLATGGLSGMAGWMEMPAASRIASAAWFLILVAASRWRAGRARATRLAPWRPLGLLGAWVALLAVVLYWRPPGLDLTRVASLDSAVITLFIPLSLAGGALVAWVLARLAPRRRTAAAFLLAIAIAVGGGSALTEVVNPVTVFADAHDLRALAWTQQHVARTALFAVDGRPWIAPSWVGVDGGYWIGAATTQRSILPPLLYAWSLAPAEVARVNALVARWSNRRPPSDDDAWSALRSAGVTHIFSGSYAADWKRSELLASRRCHPIYRDGETIVFEIRREWIKRVKNEE
jgi:hypothetical protein